MAASPPSIVFNAPRVPEASVIDGANPYFEYHVFDASGLSQATVAVHQGEGTDRAVVYERTYTNVSQVPYTRVHTNQFGTGTFTMVVSATDRDPVEPSSATDSRILKVADDDTATPTVVFYDPPAGTSQVSDNGQPRFQYEVADSSGLDSVSWVLTRDGQEVARDPAADAPADATAPNRSVVNLSAYGPGHFVLTVTATDADADSDRDALTTTASRSLTVTDDDAAGPTIAFYDPTVDALTDNGARFFQYEVTDASGLADVSWVLTRGSGGAAETLRTGSAAASRATVDLAEYGPGEFTLRVIATDRDSDSPDDSSTNNRAHSVTISDDDTAGPSIVFYKPAGDVSQVVDQDTSPIEYEVTDASGVASVRWVLTRNGQEIESATAAPTRGTVSLAGRGPGNYTLAVTAVDADGDWAGDSATATASRSLVVVDDDTAGPTIAFYDPTATTLPADGGTRRFQYEAIDSSGVGAVAWVLSKEGVQVASGSGPARNTVDFTSYGPGSFTMSVTATDLDGDWAGDNSTATASMTVQVVTPPPPDPEPQPDPDTGTAALLDDPLAPGRTMIVVNGTAGNDCIFVTQGFTVSINGAVKGTFSGVTPSRVVIYGLDGNDKIWAADRWTGAGDTDNCVFGRTATPTWLFGGNGNDLLVTGNGGGIAIGGEGRDLILGGAGRELIVGGRGGDAMTGVSADDILVAGYTTHDANEQALGAVLQEWSRRDRSYTDRIRALKGEITGQNGKFRLLTDGVSQSVFDDGARDEVDVLVGLGGLDWFLFNTGADGGASDIVLGATSGSVKSDIDAT